MSLTTRILCLAPAIVIAAGCAKGHTGGSADGGPTADASCGDLCDRDNDGVVDGSDQCPNTPMGAVVNHVGCSDSQAMWTLEPEFPPFGLTWTPTGDPGRPGGLTWTYTGIDRKDLFHIDWIICDDPTTPCGLSLDGPIDAPLESWTYRAADSDLVNGKVVFTNQTHVLHEDMTAPQVSGRLTMTIVDATDMPIRFASVETLGVTARLGKYGAEIPGTGFKVVALIEVQETVTSPWMPYLDYYDAAPTPVAGGDVYMSYGGSFYDK
jgi:hypothetical protein